MLNKHKKIYLFNIKKASTTSTIIINIMVLQPEPSVSKKLSPFFLVNNPMIKAIINITISVVINELVLVFQLFYMFVM